MKKLTLAFGLMIGLVCSSNAIAGSCPQLQTTLNELTNAETALKAAPDVDDRAQDKALLDIEAAIKNINDAMEKGQCAE